jgi:hypothetical protein
MNPDEILQNCDLLARDAICLERLADGVSPCEKQAKDRQADRQTDRPQSLLASCKMKINTSVHSLILVQIDLNSAGQSTRTFSPLKVVQIIYSI